MENVASLRVAARSVATVAGLSLLLAAGRAHANGRYPAAGQIVMAPDDVGVLAVRATFGLLLSRDAGRTWDWVCEAAAGYGTSVEDPPLALTTAKALLVATQEGLAVSSNTGCSWKLHPELGAPFVDLVVGDDAHAAYGLSAAAAAPGPGGEARFKNVVQKTTDDGVSWTTLGAALDADVIVETIEVAKSDPSRLYVSAWRYGATSTEGILYVSTDGGAHVTARALPMTVDETAPFVSAVDPTNADLVYVRVQNATAGTTRRTVSHDGGRTFTDAYRTKGEMLGFALSADGSKVFVGGLDDGVLEAPRATLTFHQVSSLPVQCLAYRGSSLYACSTEVNGGFAVGVSRDEGATFTSTLHLGCIRGPLACASGAEATQCKDRWPATQATLAACLPTSVDAGGGVDGGSTEADAAASSRADGGTRGSSVPGPGADPGDDGAGEALDGGRGREHGVSASSGGSSSGGRDAGGCSLAPSSGSPAFARLGALALGLALVRARTRHRRAMR